ncbi:MAG: pyridoxal-phosphate-dependent aminotransferase family protein [Prochlorotrichaceae cyanobacterium]|jgi:alanine-glyoxylate transaminase/serine-glyoxylate transaminase/serine-pyruvate transaminase
MTFTAIAPKQTINDTFRLQLSPLEMPERLLMGAGPSNADPRVVAALDRQPIGHLDPEYLRLMDEVQKLLRYAWQTQNAMTYPVPGTGSAAMEATLANTVEPGDVVLVAVKGYFGKRLVDMASRYRADVRTIDAEWGTAFSLPELREAIATHRPKILAMVHAETSTGVLQPMEGIGDLCREFDCLLILDTVTSLGSVPIFLDDWKVDLAYSCSQKGLSCPPGISPFSMSDRAIEKLDQRTTPVANWYLDNSLLRKYWGGERTYHHTAPVNMTYGLREALRLLAEEGLEARWERHQSNAEKLWAGLDELGLECFVAPELRLPTLTSIKVPDNIDAKAFQLHLLQHHNIEIGVGLGVLAGKVWRIGIMGANSYAEKVDRLLAVLAESLAKGVGRKA